MEPVPIKIEHLVYNTLNIYDYEDKDYKDGKKTPYDIFTLCNSIEKFGLKHPIEVTPNGDDIFEVLNGRWRVEAYRRLGIIEILCYIVNIAEKDKTDFTLIDNLYRIKNELVQYREALIRLKDLPKGSSGRYEKSIDGKPLTTITGLFQFESVIEMDKEIEEKYPPKEGTKEKKFGLLKKFEDGKITIAQAYNLGKDKLASEEERKVEKDKTRIENVITDKYVVFNEDSTNMEFLREYLKKFNILLKLGIVSVPYGNQRTYDKDDKDEIGREIDPISGKFDPVKYINNLKKIFKETYDSTADDFIQCVNIADTYSCEEDYILSHDIVTMMVKELDLYHLINDIIWVKDGLMRGDEDTRMTGTYEHILVFCKKVNRNNYKNNYYPINIYHDKPVEMIQMSGRRNPNGSSTKSKMALSKTYTRFADHISEQKFIDYIETQNAGKDNRLMKKDHKTDQVAMYPLILPLFLILTYSKPGDWVLDQMAGSGTTNACSILNNRPTIAIEKIPKYAKLIRDRLKDIASKKDYDKEMAEEIEKLFNEKFSFTEPVPNEVGTALQAVVRVSAINDIEKIKAVLEKDFAELFSKRAA